MRGAEATLWRVTVLKRIPEAVRQRLGVVPLSNFPVGEAENSLAAAADRFSERFIAGDGSAPGYAGSGGSGGGGGGSGFKPPTFARLRAEGGRRFALFKTALSNNGSTIDLRGHAEVERSEEHTSELQSLM